MENRKILIVGPGSPPAPSEVIYTQARRCGKSMEKNIVVGVDPGSPDLTTIVVVGKDAEAFIGAIADQFPTVKLIPAEEPPKDNTPYVFTNPEMQKAKKVAEDFRLKRDLSPDPVDYNNNPRNRRERRALAAKSRRRQ